MSRPSNVRTLDTRASFDTISLSGAEGDIAAAIMWRMIVDLSIQEGSERSDNLTQECAWFNHEVSIDHTKIVACTFG